MVEKLFDEIESHFTSDNYDSDEMWEVIEMLGEHGKEVERTFEQGGRWSNYETVVYAVEAPEQEERYFALTREVPATEMQDGGDFTWDFTEVYRKEKTVIVYE